MCMKLRAEDLEAADAACQGDPQDLIRAYKVFDVLSDCLLSPFCPMHAGGQIKMPGEQQSSRESAALTPNERKYGDVSEGFHVLLTRADAETYIENMRLHGRVVVPISFRRGDLVATGVDDNKRGLSMAVVTRYTISGPAFKRAVSRTT